jgi:isocitrate dehydrogenase kinase/phosphatase
MKVLLLFVACLVALTPVASAQSDFKLEINARLPRRYVPRRIKQVMVTGPARTPPRPFIRKAVGGIEYYIAFEEKTRKIKYIDTSDKNFRTENGLRPGMEITVTKDQLYVGPWWWYVLAPVTPDGWLPVLDPLGEGDENLRQMLGKLKEGEKTSIRIVSFIKSGDLK